MKDEHITKIDCWAFTGAHPFNSHKAAVRVHQSVRGGGGTGKEGNGYCVGAQEELEGGGEDTMGE